MQEQAFAHIREQLEQYQAETKGVYIQDVILPVDLVTVLTHREIANQEIETYKKQRSAEEERIEMEQAKGTADMQGDLARSKVGIQIKKTTRTAAWPKPWANRNLFARRAPRRVRKWKRWDWRARKAFRPRSRRLARMLRHWST